LRVRGLANGEIAMNIKASGRSALIITAALWLCAAGPMRATESDARTTDTTKADGSAGAPVALNKFTKPRAKKHTAAAASKSSKTAAKTSDVKKPDDADASKDDGATPIPPSVANANARLQGDTAADNALKVASAQADSALQSAKQDDQANVPAANTEVVSADQLNEVDRSLTDEKAPTATLALASMTQTSARLSSDDSTWNQTSLIGKIFIAFGGLLTLASAARMFMA
jgi:hypothetical protein